MKITFWIVTPLFAKRGAGGELAYLYHSVNFHKLNSPIPGSTFIKLFVHKYRFLYQNDINQSKKVKNCKIMVDDAYSGQIIWSSKPEIGVQGGDEYGSSLASW